MRDKNEKVHVECNLAVRFLRKPEMNDNQDG